MPTSRLKSPVKKKAKKIRYAVMGLGWIARDAVLPAFVHAGRNSELVTLFYHHPSQAAFGTQYGLEKVYSYKDFERGLREQRVDAIYLALPNHLHREYTLRAAKLGVHVLSEKPLAVTSADCRAMIAGCRKHGVKLMTAYRLHLERGNLTAIRWASSGKLGQIRFFNSYFTMQVKPGDIRTKKEWGGGTLYDIGIYCINTIRSLFRAEPTEVFAASVEGSGRRFGDVDELSSCVLRFPGNRIATFTTSFSSDPENAYELFGTKGHLRVDNGYAFPGPSTHRVTIGGKTATRTFGAHDQFGPELLYFSDCILHDRTPEPSGEEGLIDIEIIEALLRSARLGRPVKLKTTVKRTRPDLRQLIESPAL
ncbi:Gfo/Idh/MocA family oxidoreductase [Verrucomicrobium sp. GAS474]|uniref:Gfo/Idh/MocA family protein n=1 Tax=Verrucomicrobium sp. GAS474 TaxID=1882831 RepID=UPI000B84BFAA|nr:Gfo/Idh/MocA family oxidoreductase [Verrucomicrobium sp. GAS474]